MPICSIFARGCFALGDLHPLPMAMAKPFCDFEHAEHSFASFPRQGGQVGGGFLSFGQAQHVGRKRLTLSLSKGGNTKSTLLLLSCFLREEKAGMKGV